jgi:citrate synthase
MEYKDIFNYAKEQESVCRKNDVISDKLFQEYGVNRGLRDQDGKGVLTGLTNISKITAFDIVDGKQVPSDGRLWYRGYPIETLVSEAHEKGHGFERAAYLLLFGQKPTDSELKKFCDMLAICRDLPTNFTRDVIMRHPTQDIMNSMTKSILALSSYDSNPVENTVENSLRQCIQLIIIQIPSFPQQRIF